jgi:hypothetical protein
VKKLLLVGTAVLLLATGTVPVTAHLITMGEYQRNGTHWCNWSATLICKRWRAGWRPSCPPGNNWSGCVAQRKGPAFDYPPR